MLTVPEEEVNSTRAIGLKWMVNHGISENLREAIKFINKEDIRVVVLVRDNVLRQAISYYSLMHQNGISSHTDKAHMKKYLKKTGKPEISAEYFQEYFRRHRDEREVLMKVASGVENAMIVHYEDFCESKEEYLQRIQEFIGVEPKTEEILASVDMVQTRIGPVKDYVADWSNVRKELMATPWGHLVEEWEKDIVR